MARLGADVEALDQLASSFGLASGRLNSLVASMDGAVRSSWWEGPNADGFRRYWYGSARRSAEVIIAEFERLGLELARQAGEQRAASDMSGGSGSAGSPVGASGVGGRGPGPIGAVNPFDVLGLANSVLGAGDDARLAYTLTMVGLARLGMHVHRGNPAAFNYYRGATGGFTSSWNSQVAKGSKGAVIGAGISAASFGWTVHQHGIGSSEAAASAVDNGIGAAVSFVPLGGLAYEGGKLIGEGLYHHTAIGDELDSRHVVNDHANTADQYGREADAAVRRGNFEAANRANDLARREAERALEASSGWTGLWNSTKTLNPFS